MDRTLELVLAAVVISVLGFALLLIFNGQSGDFTNFLDSESENAQCDLHLDRYETAKEEGDCDEMEANFCSAHQNECEGVPGMVSTGACSVSQSDC